MSNRNLQSSFTTTSHDKQDEPPAAPMAPTSSDALQQSSVNAEPWSAVSGTAIRALATFKVSGIYARSQQSSSDTGTNTLVDDDLADTRSIISRTGSIQGQVAKRLKLFRSRSCDDSSLRAPATLPGRSFGKRYLDTAQRRARSATLDFVDDIRKALHEEYALRTTPAWDGTTIQGSPTTGSPTLSSTTLNDDSDLCDPFWDASTLGSINANAVIHTNEPLQTFPPEEELDLELLRLSQEKSHAAQTTCVFCDCVFSGPDHRQMAIDHILNHRQTGTQSPETVKQRTMSPVRLAKTANEVRSEWLTLDPLKATEIRSEAPLLSSSRMSRIDLDLLGIGSWCPEEYWIREEAARPIIAAVVITDDIHMVREPDLKSLLDTVLTHSRGDGPEADPERINDLFNGLDVVTEDLSCRFPEDETVRCISSVLNSLAQGTVSDLHSRQANETIPHIAGPSGVSTCPVAQESESTTFQGSTLDSARGEQHFGNSTGCYSPLGERRPSDVDNRANPTVSVHSTKQKPKRRNLACPFRKDDEVHGRHPTCSHQGSSSMSSLKGHLKSSTHSIELNFISLCRNCANYIVDISEWQTLHLTKLCIRHLGKSTKQVRGEGAVKQWQNLYMKVFPRSERIPHPYAHNQSWQHKDQWTQRHDAEYNVMNANADFDFNRLSSPQPSQRTSESGTRANSTMPNVSTPYQSLNSSLEQMAAENGRRLSNPGTRSPDAPQTFLEQPHPAACDRFMPAGRMPYPQHPPIQEASFFTVASASSQAGQHDLTGIYPNYTPNQPLSQSTPMPQITGIPTHPTMMHSEPQGNTMHEIRIATLSVLVDYLESCRQAVAASSWALQAQRISQVHGMDTEESDLVGNELLATIRRRVEQIRSEAAVGDQAHANM